MAELCPFCGAYSRRACELEEETGGECPWEMDPDILREDRDERARLAAEHDDMVAAPLQVKRRR